MDILLPSSDSRSGLRRGRCLRQNGRSAASCRIRSPTRSPRDHRSTNAVCNPVCPYSRLCRNVEPSQDALDLRDILGRDALPGQSRHSGGRRNPGRRAALVGVPSLVIPADAGIRVGRAAFVGVPNLVIPGGRGESGSAGLPLSVSLTSSFRRTPESSPRTKHGAAIQVRQAPHTGSRHVGLPFSINSSFHARFHSLIAFSRVIALAIDSCAHTRQGCGRHVAW